MSKRSTASFLLVATLSLGLAISLAGCSSNSSGVAPRSTASDSGTLSIEDAKEFNDFPVFWLGESSQGMPLERISRYVWSDPSADSSGVDHSQDLFTLTYGKCTIPVGQEGCPVPLQVQFTPYCKVPPDLIADRAKNGDFFDFRGAKALWALGDSTLFLWTGTVHVSISSPMGKDVVQSAAEELVSLNSSETGSREDNLPADAAPT